MEEDNCPGVPCHLVYEHKFILPTARNNVTFNLCGMKNKDAEQLDETRSVIFSATVDVYSESKGDQ